MIEQERRGVYERSYNAAIKKYNFELNKYKEVFNNENLTLTEVQNYLLDEDHIINFTPVVLIQSAKDYAEIKISQIELKIKDAGNMYARIFQDPQFFSNLASRFKELCTNIIRLEKEGGAANEIDELREQLSCEIERPAKFF